MTLSDEEKENLERANKCLIVLLDTRDGKYDTLWYAANLTYSEMVALCMDVIRNAQDRSRDLK